VAQLFTQHQGNRKIVGTVGALQFDVLQYRLNTSMGQLLNLNLWTFIKRAGLPPTNNEAIENFVDSNLIALLGTRTANRVFLAESEWVLRNMIEAYPEIKFISPRV